MKEKKIQMFCGTLEGLAKDKVIKFMKTTGQNAKNIADGINQTHPPIYGWLQGSKTLTFATWDKINDYMDKYKSK